MIFDIDGIKFFTFGGASSHDIQDGILEKGDSRIKKWRHEFRRFRINHYEPVTFEELVENNNRWYERTL